MASEIITKLKDLLEGSTVLSINEIEDREAICEFNIKKGSKQRSFVLYGNDLGAWIGCKSNPQTGGEFNNMDDLIEAAWSHHETHSKCKDFYSKSYTSLDDCRKMMVDFKCAFCNEVFSITLIGLHKSPIKDCLKTVKDREQFASKALGHFCSPYLVADDVDSVKVSIVAFEKSLKLDLE